MQETVSVAGLRVTASLYALVLDEISPETGLDGDDVWRSLAAIVADLAHAIALYLIREISFKVRSMHG